MSYWNTEIKLLKKNRFDSNFSSMLLLALTRRNIITKEWNLPKSALKITVINGLNIMMTVLPNGLFSLSLANLWFLIPLGHDILKCSSNNGPLELLSSLGTFFGDIGFNTLIVFPSVENRPCHFSWISFEKMSTMTSTIQKFKHLNTNKSPGFYWRISDWYINHERGQSTWDQNY